MPLKIVSHLAIILDEKGDNVVKIVKINPKNNVFRVGLKDTYIFKPSHSTILVQDSWLNFIEKRFYFYNKGCPYPLKLVKSYNPLLSSEELNIFIDTEVLRKLNDLAKKNWLLDLLTPTNIIIAVVVIGLLYWYFGIKGGKL